MTVTAARTTAHRAAAPDPVPARRLRLESGAFTHPGPRGSNEDAFLASAPVFVVADGVGGHRHGEAASGAVVRRFEALVGAPTVRPAAVGAAIRAAAADVAALADGRGPEPGSTLAGVAWAVDDGDPAWLVVGIGDSRVYLLRGGVLRQVTTDHTLAQELRDAGAEEVAAGSTLLTRALGRGVPLADQWLLPAAAGDRVLVCTDGLTRVVDDATLAAVLSAEPGPTDAARALLRAAVRGGAVDDVTVVVVDAIGEAGSGAEGEHA